MNRHIKHARNTEIAPPPPAISSLKAPAPAADTSRCARALFKSIAAKEVFTLYAATLNDAGHRARVLIDGIPTSLSANLQHLVERHLQRTPSPEVTLDFTIRGGKRCVITLGVENEHTPHQSIFLVASNVHSEAGNHISRTTFSHIDEDQLSLWIASALTTTLSLNLQAARDSLHAA